MIHKSRAIILKSRPSGQFSTENLAFADKSTGPLAPDEVLVQTKFFSVDPYMRNRMNDVKSYVEPYALEQPITGDAAGLVLESRAPDFKPDEWVTGVMPWQEYTVMPGRYLHKIADRDVSPTLYLGLLGLTGLTAYFGLLDIGKPVSGETVVVSGAAGAVGSIAGQIARIKGCHTIGIAGSDEKCSYLTEKLGFSGTINYKSRPNIRKQLRGVCPAGVDVYFDNVGGEISDSVMFYLNNFARIVLCGQISLYDTNRLFTGPRLLAQMIIHRVQMQGFIVYDYRERYAEAREQLYRWLKEGKLISQETILEGFEKLPQALTGLFTGENIGKQIVKV